MSGSSEGDAEGGEGSAWVTGVLAEGGNRHARVDPNDSLGLRVPLDIGGAVTGGVDVAVEDLDAHHQRAKAAGAQIVQELTDDGYGRRCGDDLEGHPWGFGDYRPSDEEVDGLAGGSRLPGAAHSAVMVTQRRQQTRVSARCGLVGYTRLVMPTSGSRRVAWQRSVVRREHLTALTDSSPSTCATAASATRQPGPCCLAATDA
jgi:Glyoxalase/Bleomycin resistance protein/Dioxygenase superfamily